MAELMSDKVDFKAKKITGDRKTLYSDKSVTLPEDIAILNAYA